MKKFTAARYEIKNSPFIENFNEDSKYILTSIRENKLEVDEKIIIRALELCFDMHRNIKLLSGCAGYIYYYNIALILIRELKISDTSVITAALLSNIRDNYSQIIEEEFDSSTNNLIRELAKISYDDDHLSIGTSTITSTNIKINNINNFKIKDNKAEIYRSLFLAIAKDVRIFIIKLCDRLHRLRTLEYLPKEKQLEVAEDILKVYAPFAHRLGLSNLQSELESRSFYFLDNPLHTQILEFIAEKKEEFSEYMFMFIDEVRDVLKENNFEYHLENISKQEYEIFSLLVGGKKIEEITDLFSLEIVLHTNKKKDCYSAYNSLASKFNSLMSNYISSPKEDSYNSIVTELYTISGVVKIIIRTSSMKLAATKGCLGKDISSLNSHKLLNISDEDAILWGSWMKNITEQKGEQASQIIWNSIRNNVFSKTITVYTRENVPIILPENSTLIDFAFSISKETGLHAITAKVNNIIKNIFSNLEDGDVIEIITSNKCHPDSSWLNHIVSFRATCYLYDYFKTNYKLRTKYKSKIKTSCELDYSTIHICSARKNNFLELLIDTIEQEKIRRIRLLPESVFFEVAIDTNKLTIEQSNLYFSSLFKLQGVKKVCIT